MSKTYSLHLTEDQAKQLVGLLDLSVKAERLNSVVNALLAAPSEVPQKAKEILDLVKENDSTPVPEDR